MEVSSGQLRYVFYSAVIAFVLVAQAIASFGNSDRYFPFLWYPMYAKAHYEGERLDVGHKVYALTSDGVRHPVLAADLNIDFWRFERRFARPLRAGRADEIQGFLQTITKQYPSIVSLEVDDYPMIITRDGPKPAPLRTVATLPRNKFESQRP